MQTYRCHAHSHVPRHHLGKYAVGMAITFVVVQIPSLGHVFDKQGNDEEVLVAQISGTKFGHEDYV